MSAVKAGPEDIKNFEAGFERKIEIWKEQDLVKWFDNLWKNDIEDKFKRLMHSDATKLRIFNNIRIIIRFIYHLR